MTYKNKAGKGEVIISVLIFGCVATAGVIAWYFISKAEKEKEQEQKTTQAPIV